MSSQQREFMQKLVKLFGFSDIEDYKSTFTASSLTKSQSQSLCAAVLENISDIRKHFSSRELNIDKSKDLETLTVERCLGIFKKCLDASIIPYEVFRKGNLSSLRLIPIKTIVESYIRQMGDAYVIRRADKEETERAVKCWEKVDKNMYCLTNCKVVEPLSAWLNSEFSNDTLHFQVTEEHYHNVSKHSFYDFSVAEEVVLESFFNLSKHPIVVEGFKTGNLRTNCHLNDVDGVDLSTTKLNHYNTNYYREFQELVNSERLVLHRNVANPRAVDATCIVNMFTVGPKLTVNGVSLDTDKFYVAAPFNYPVFEVEFINGAEFVEGFYHVGIPREAITWTRDGNIFRPTISSDFRMIKSSVDQYFATEEQSSHCVNFSKIAYSYIVLNKSYGVPADIKIITRNYNVVNVTEFEDGFVMGSRRFA